jgi:hypothetical protein
MRILFSLFISSLLLGQDYGVHLEKPSGNGVVVKVPNYPYTVTRQFEAGNGLVVTNADGVAGNPRYVIASQGGILDRKTTRPMWDEVLGAGCSAASYFGLFKWGPLQFTPAGGTFTSHWGVCGQATEMTANTSYRNNGTSLVNLSAGIVDFEYQFLIRTSAITAVKYKVGLSTPVMPLEARPTDGLVAAFSNATGCTTADSSPNWAYYVANGGTWGINVSTVPVAANSFYTIRIRGVAGQAWFSIATGNGAFSPEVGPISANFPTANLVPFIGVVTCEAVQKTIILDTFGYKVTLDR